MKKTSENLDKKSIKTFTTRTELGLERELRIPGLMMVELPERFHKEKSEAQSQFFNTVQVCEELP